MVYLYALLLKSICWHLLLNLQLHYSNKVNFLISGYEVIGVTKKMYVKSLQMNITIFK